MNPDRNQDDDLQRLRWMLPVPAERDFPAGRRLQREEHLMTSWLAMSHRPERRRGSLVAGAVPLRRGLLRRRWTVSAALVAAAATGITVLPAVGLGGEPAVNASAATFLNQLADQTDAAARHHGGNETAVGRLKGAPYWKVVAVQSGLNSKSLKSTTYISSKDGSSREYFDSSSGYVKTDNTKLRTMHWFVGGRSVDVAGLDRLPTDTAGLRAALTRDGYSSVAVLTEVSALLESPAAPKLRAALFRVLAQMPGVHLDGTRKDIQGRCGTQISASISGPEWGGTMRSTMLVQPSTGTLLQGDTYQPTKEGLMHFVDTLISTGPAWGMPR